MDWSQLCLQMCRIAWGIPTPMFRDAYAAWQGSSQQFDMPLAGAPIYWDHILIGGVPRRELGHVAIADAEPGWCWSIDILRSHPGRVDRVPIDLVRTKWGGRFLGWTSDLEGVTLPLGETGTSVDLPVGSHGIDAAGMAGSLNYQPVADAGYRWMSMYVGGTYGVRRSNVDAAWAAGLHVILNFERAADAYLGGAVLGDSHARLGLQQGEALGWQGECPMIFSATDTNVASSNVWLADAYYHSMVDVFQSAGRVGGAYGPPSYLRHLVAQDWWPGEFPLWQWAGAGQVEAWTTVKQVFTPTHDVSAIGYTIDENHVYKPLAAWAPPGSTPSEDDLTGPEHDALMFCQQFVGELWTALTQPIPGTTDPSMQWCSVLTYDRLAKDDRYVNQIAAAVVAALPPAQSGGLTQAQVIDAVKQALAQVAINSVGTYDVG